MSRHSTVDKEIWLSRYRNIDSLRKFLDDECRNIHPCSRREAQRNFNIALSQMILYRADVNMLKSGTSSYRWVVHYSLPHVTSNVTEHFICVKSNLLLKDDCVLGLQLRAKLSRGGTKWYDWVHIKNRLSGDDVGLYASRDFPKGCIVGVLAGQKTASSDDAANTCKKIKDNKGQEINVLLSADFGDSLYLGFQFAKENSDFNCEILDDGRIRSTTRILSGSEIFLPGGF